MAGLSRPRGDDPTRWVESRRAREQGGFTLVEMLVAVMIEGLVVGALAMAFVGILRGTGQVSQSLLKSGDARIAAAYFVNDASNSSGPEISLTDTTSCADAHSPVAGTAAPVVRFNSTVTSSTGASRANTVIYYLASSTGIVPFSLVRRECQSGLLTSDVVLAANVASANVACSPNAIPQCSGTPGSITVTITETPDSNGAVYSFILTGTFQKLIGGGVPPPPASVILLGTDGACVGTPSATGISLTGSARLTVYGGDAYIDATDVAGCTAMSMNNSGAFTHVGTTSFLSGGSCSGSGCPVSTSYASTIVDPYKTLAAPSTAAMTSFSSSSCSGTLQPGNYTSGLSITTGPCTLASGIYVVQGGLTVSNGASLASAAGGVLIYIKSGTFSVGGGSPVTLSAMTSGPYAGLVLWQATLSSTITFNNGGQITLTGTLYAPGAQLNVQGGSATPSVTSILVRTLVMGNNGSVTVGAPLVIASPVSLPASGVNQAYPATTINGTGGGGDYSWSATGLPAGLAIDASTGVVSGSPSTSGVFSVVVTLNDSVGDNPDTQGYTLTISPPPAVVSVSPSSRPQGTTSQSVTINGSGFASGAGVAFSGTGITVNSTAFVNSTTLIANITIAAAAATGTRDVTVVNPDTGVGVGTGVFTVNPTPMVTSVSPAARGQGAASQNVTITGSGFANGAGVAFSGTGITVSSTTFVNSTTLIANITIAPGATTGTRNVTVINPDTGVGVGTAVFTVNLGSTVTSVSPSSRPQGATSQNVTITGSRFVSGATVSFSGGGITVNSTVFVSSTTVTANITIDAGAATGASDVTVVNPDSGGIAGTAVFTVNGAPNVVSSSPSSRPQGAASQSITITGSGFVSGAGVSFSGTLITVNSTVFVSSTTLTANITIAAGATVGPRDVTVINPDTGVDVGPGIFAVNVLPTVTSTTPSSRGQGATSQNVTITGSGFASGAGVSFSGTGISVNSTNVVNSTTLTANISIVASATLGARNVTVVNADTGVAVGSGVFTVTVAPTVTATSPTSRGQGATAQNVTVTGTGFVSGAIVSFSGTGITVNSTAFVSSTSLTANITIAAGSTIGTRDVTVTNPDAGNGTGLAKFTVSAGPTVTSASPVSRPQGATSQTITIAGTGFVTGAVVSFSGAGITVNSRVFVSSTSMTANITIAAGAATGARDVIVTNPDTGVGTGTGMFTVNAAPTVTSMSPASRGQAAPSQNVTITGSGFVSGAVPSFSGTGITVNSPIVVNSTTLTATITIAAGATLGARNVTVINPDTGVGVGTGIFTVNVAPAVTSLSPATHTRNSTGLTVVITGSGFVSGATVQLVATAGTAPTVASTTWNSATQITITLNVPNATSTDTVNVTNPDGGVGTKTAAFTST